MTRKKNQWLSYFPIIIFLALACNLNAQDLIVTNQSDSINCFISKQKAGYVYFVTNAKDSTRNINSVLPMTQVKSIVRDYYSEYVVSQVQVKQRTYPKFRAGIKSGYSRRLAPIPDSTPASLEDYFKQIKNGIHLGIDLTYFFNKVNGIALIYALHNSKASGLTTISVGSGITLNNVIVTDNISIHFFGPAYTARFLSNHNSNAFYLRAGLGYTGYRDRILFNQSALEVKATTVGTLAEAGYDIAVMDSFAISLTLGLITGYYEAFTIEDNTGKTVNENFDQGQGDNLFRLNLAVGISFF